MYDIFSGKTAFTTLATSAEICYIDLEIQKNNVLEGGFILHIRDAAPRDIAQSIRIDTHADNKTMQHLYCGWNAADCLPVDGRIAPFPQACGIKKVSVEFRKLCYHPCWIVMRGRRQRIAPDY